MNDVEGGELETELEERARLEEEAEANAEQDRKRKAKQERAAAAIRGRIAERQKVVEARRRGEVMEPEGDGREGGND